MTTKQRFRAGKYRLELRERDHLPPHVHLTGAGGERAYQSGNIGAETLVHDGNCPRAVLDEVLSWVEQHRTVLLEEWKKWYP